MNRLIAIKLLWGLLCYWCYPSILIWWFRLWIISNTLDPSSEAFVIWCSVFYTRYTSLMLCILHQIHIFVNSRPGSTQPSPHASNRVSEPSLQDVHPSSLVAISLPANGLCHLANTLAIQWGSWRLSSQREEANCIQPASQPHHQLWCSKVVNPTLQQVDNLQIG